MRTQDIRKRVMWMRRGQGGQSERKTYEER